MTTWVSSQLRPDHELATFDCGNPTLNAWPREQSHRAQAAGTARTYVWTDENSTVVRAYYAVAPTQMLRGELTRTQSGGYSVGSNVPCMMPVTLTSCAVSFPELKSVAPVISVIVAVVSTGSSGSITALAVIS